MIKYLLKWEQIVEYIHKKLRNSSKLEDIKRNIEKLKN